MKFENPELLITKFDMVDVITASPGSDCGNQTEPVVCPDEEWD